MRRRPGAAAIILLAITSLPSEARAQVSAAPGVSVELNGRIQSQFNTTSVAGASSTEFLMRRVRFTATIRVNDLVSGKIQPDYGEGEIALKDAYARFTFDPRLRVTAGQFKRPFDVFELTSSADILAIERAGGIRGIDACSGPGGVCSLSRLTEALGYADRDIGVMVDGAAGRVHYAASVTNGTGADAPDENGNKSYTARLGVAVGPNIVASGNVGIHDYLHPTSGANRFASAFGGDVEVGNFDRGLHVQAGVVLGDNWLVPVGAADAATFATAQGIATYKVPVSHRWVDAVEPLVRVSWADPDTDTDADDGILVTPGLNLFFGKRNRLATNVDIWMPSTGDTEFSVKVQTFFYF